MKETKFKVLTHCKMYVDVNMLDKGIYVTTRPYLHHNEETIDKLISRAENIRDTMGKHHISESYFENLKQCTLIEVQLVFQAVP